MMYEVIFKKNGFGGIAGRWTEHRYAVRIAGEWMRSKAGAIRTFTSRQSAEKAALKVTESRV